MSLIGDITGLGSVATAASDALKAVPDILSKFIPDPTARLQAEAEVQKAVQDGMAAQYNAMASVMTADSHSDSAYTRGARPTVVYWSLAMVTFIAGASLFGYSHQVTDALANAPAQLWTTIQYGIGIYTAGRSAEKVSSVAASAVKAIIARKR